MKKKKKTLEEHHTLSFPIFILLVESIYQTTNTKSTKKIITNTPKKTLYKNPT